MKVIKQGYEIIEDHNPIRKIERIARTCYKSEDKITTGSADNMVRSLIKSGHLAMLEHGSAVLVMCQKSYDYILKIASVLEHYLNHPTMLRATNQGRCVISANFRAWYEFLKGCSMYGFDIPDGLMDTLMIHRPIFDEFAGYLDTISGYDDIEVFDPLLGHKPLTTSESLLHKDLTVKFITDRGVSHEIVRHRIASFAQESTRYCNYSKDKFGNELTFIKPVNLFGKQYQIWERAMSKSESDYFDMIINGATPEIARGVLPNGLKTELVMTANFKEWRHFFELRTVGTTGKPHPQIKALTRPLLADLYSVYPEDFIDVFNSMLGT
jgi:thymidylate synthase (FAD)